MVQCNTFKIVVVIILACYLLFPIQLSNYTTALLFVKKRNMTPKQISFRAGYLPMDGPKKFMNKPDRRVLWPNAVVPYRIHLNAGNYVAQIENGIKIWEDGTCIEFLRLPDAEVEDEKEKEEEEDELIPDMPPIFEGSSNTNVSNENKEENSPQFKEYFEGFDGFDNEMPPDDEEPEFQENMPLPFVLFMEQRGCTSYVGRQWWNRDGQVISVGRDCDMVAMAHEIGHALGLYHEHSRPDRDDFVIIMKHNIDPRHIKNFLVRNISTNESPYDLASVMHYGPKTFSINGENTIVPLNILQSFKLKERYGLSFYDKKFVNKLYNCSAHCPILPECENEGFVDKNCQCHCRPGFKGQLCQIDTRITGSSNLCGWNITFHDEIHSPGFPGSYPENIECLWWVQAKENRTIKAIFHYFRIAKRKLNGKCGVDELELRGDDLYNGTSYCGKELHRKRIKSSSNTMLVLFRAGKAQKPTYGFKASIRILKPEQEGETDDNMDEDETDDERGDDDADDDEDDKFKVDDLDDFDEPGDDFHAE